MKIGYDAKRFYNNFTGLGNYSRTLVETLAAEYPENDYLLFTPDAVDSPRVGFLKRYRNIFAIEPRGIFRLFRAIWRTYGMRSDILKSGIQIYHGLSGELPVGEPCLDSPEGDDGRG